MESKKPTVKKRTRRSKVRYPALERKYNLRSRQDFADMDYIDKLGPAEKDFLNRFIEETVNANFNHPGKVLIRDKKEQKKVYKANNARNRDVYNRKKTTGDMIFLGDKTIDNKDYRIDDDAIIAKVDSDLKYEQACETANELSNTLEDTQD